MISFKTKTLVAVLLGIFVATAMHAADVEKLTFQNALLEGSNTRAGKNLVISVDRQLAGHLRSVNIPELLQGARYAYRNQELVGITRTKYGSGQTKIIEFIVAKDEQAYEACLYEAESSFKPTPGTTIALQACAFEFAFPHVLKKHSYELLDTVEHHATNHHGPARTAIYSKTFNVAASPATSQSAQPKSTSWKRYALWTGAAAVAVLGLYAWNKVAPQHFSWLSSWFTKAQPTNIR